MSAFWNVVKRTYCSSLIGRWLVTGTFIPMFAAINLAADMKNGRNPAAGVRSYIKKRGMSMVHDWVDWLGGYPFEVAGAGEVHQYLQQRGFSLERLFTTPSLGCNEFLFVRSERA
ncbi:MAG: hypothetical protein U5K74_01475 [Gemmatimonadaceae bacterium]|nr:hypothetical protein [Gemmatimonadaceae bacterium]